MLAVFVESLNYIERVLLFLCKSGPSFAMVTWSEEVERKTKSIHVLVGTSGCEMKFPRREHCVVWIYSSNSDPFPRVIERARLR